MNPQATGFPLGYSTCGQTKNPLHQGGRFRDRTSTEEPSKSRLIQAAGHQITGQKGPQF
jgi:hypothetical protein